VGLAAGRAGLGAVPGLAGRALVLNHLAFTARGRDEVDRLTASAPEHGWSLLFADRHPHAGGPDTYAAYLEDNWGYEVEIQSEPPS
jgi:hypothetical protein